MKKKLISILTTAALCITLAGCSQNTEGGSNNEGGTQAPTNTNGGDAANTSSNDPAPSGDAISLRVWGPEEDQSLISEMVEKFKAAYPDQNFKIEIGVESEGTAKDTILTDVSAAADVFAFASDQLNDLVAANALANLTELDAVFQGITGKSIDDIKSQNVEGSVIAATKNDILYALPLGAGNNYFLYYNKSKVSDSDAATWDGLLAAAGTAGEQVGMVFNSGWWNGGFFLGAGFTVSGNEDGSSNMEWNKTSPDGISGVDVVKGMIGIASNSAFRAVNDGDTAVEIAAGGLCAIVSGSWDLEAIETAWGAENVGISKLPTYTCGDKQVQQGCYSGFKLMGVNAMSQQVGWATVLAEFLTNEEAQVMRFNARQLAPTNNKAASADVVTSNAMVAASVAQDAACGVIQDVGGNYWAPTKTFGEMIAQGQLSADNTDAIQEALDNMVAGVQSPTA